MFEDVSEKTHQSYLAIAEYNNCDVYDVYDAFDDNPTTTYYTPEAIRKSAQDAENLSDFAKHLRKAIQAIRSVSPGVQGHIEQDGVSSLSVIQKIEQNASAWCQFYKNRTMGLERRGGKNWAALMAAASMARLYEILNKPTTFGHFDGNPTTDFGRSVSYAFEALGIDANWREPTKYASKLTRKP